MKRHRTLFIRQPIMASGLLAKLALADTTITTFDDFNLEGLFGNWVSATVVSGPTSYSITASGYGSGFKDINPDTTVVMPARNIGFLRVQEL